MIGSPLGTAPGAALYLDANASEPLRPEARDAVLAALGLGANPSAVHAAGRAARRVLEAAREALAERFGARPQDVVFTAGGTEANALAIHSLGRGRRVLVGATEHPAVLAAAPDATCLPVLPDGTADLPALAALLAASGPALVCLMAANNETGVLHPLAAIAALCRRHGALLHVDAVQAAGRLPLEAIGASSVADTLALSGHKLGGPAGAGALLLRPGLEVTALIAGGGQERGRRGGTESLPAIAGMAAAAQAASPDAAVRLAALRDRVEAGVRALAPDALIAGADAPRLPNTSCIVLPGVAAETQVIALDLVGVRVSAGAACSSGKVARSAVLEAMGFGAAAGCGIRVSLPWDALVDAPERFLHAWAAMRRRLSKSAA